MIELDNIGKRFRYDWIFKNITHTFQSGKSYALLGPNGSGKSTLMKILSGHLTPSVGDIHFKHNDTTIDPENLYRAVSYAAPYIDLIEEMTLTEMIEFYTQLKPISNQLTTKDVIDILGFQKSKNKEIRFFSSGMKQRLKLALAICANTSIVLLDEPTTNLDTQGVTWYQNLVKTYAIAPQRTVIVASNIEQDYLFCQNFINITDFK